VEGKGEKKGSWWYVGRKVASQARPKAGGISPKEYQKDVKGWYIEGRAAEVVFENTKFCKRKGWGGVWGIKHNSGQGKKKDAPVKPSRGKGKKERVKGGGKGGGHFTGTSVENSRREKTVETRGQIINKGQSRHEE